MYALGATLYHALTGRPPFLRDTPKETLRAQLYDRPAPIRGIAADVDAELENVVLRMLEKKREDRFVTWRDAVHALASSLSRSASGQTGHRGAMSRLLSSLLR
jgi:serine/threonine protein kinase